MVQKFIDINQKQSCFQTGPNSRIFLVTAIGSFFLVTAVGSYTSRFRQCLPYLISELLTQSTCDRLPRPLQAGMLFGLWISARYTSPGGTGTRISLNYGPLLIVSTATKSKRIVIGGLTPGEWPGGIAPPGSRRTRRKSLNLPGSHRPTFSSRDKVPMSEELGLVLTNSLQPRPGL